MQPWKNNWLRGTVIHGDGRGRGIGFPTANIQLDQPNRRPADGVYAIWAQLNEKSYQAVAHVGPRPTFPGTTTTIEVHLLDFPDRDLYGQSLNIQFVQKIRDIAHFYTVDELVIAIKQDCTTARHVLQGSDVFRNR